jgi:hypothetical protein
MIIMGTSYDITITLSEVDGMSMQCGGFTRKQNEAWTRHVMRVDNMRRCTGMQGEALVLAFLEAEELWLKLEEESYETLHNPRYWHGGSFYDDEEDSDDLSELDDDDESIDDDVGLVDDSDKPLGHIPEWVALRAHGDENCPIMSKSRAGVLTISRP